MKRLFFFAALVLAIGSYGGHINPAHAQTLTPSDTASLQQQLDVAKATLANLEAQAGVIPTGDAGSVPTVTVAAPVVATPVAVAQPVAAAAAAPKLTAADIATFQNTLSELTVTLTQLNASLAVNASISPTQEASVDVTLNGMKGTLVAMANAINASNGVVATPVAAPAVAATAPSNSTVAVNTQPSIAAATPTVTATVSPTDANQPVADAPQTAQASSFWSFTKAHWPTIVIVLIVLAILAILFWPEKESVKTVSTSASGSGKPKSAPTPSASFSATTVPAAPSAQATHSVPAPATPVASAVAAPAQR